MFLGARIEACVGMGQNLGVFFVANQGARNLRGAMWGYTPPLSPFFNFSIIHSHIYTYHTLY